MKQFLIKTFGCQMNYSDSERIAAMLEKIGYKQVFDREKADFLVINTCGVRQSAENRVYGLVNNLRKKYPVAKIVLTGCIAHRKDVWEKLKNKVNLFFNINDFEKLKNYFKIKKLKLKIPARKNNALVPVMTGCNNFCSYCVVPYARGREYSRPAKEVLNEVKELIRNGYREIFLIGQNVNSYRSGKLNFAKLIEKINAIPGDFWIRFLTSHPKDMSDELIETLAKSKKVCAHINLPIQSGSDEILLKMNRKYTARKYLGLIKKLRSAFRKYRGADYPLSLSTDIIVGFPTETRKQFNETKKIIEKVGYDMIFINKYSPRPQTAALKFSDNVTNDEKKRRWKILDSILKKSAVNINQKFIGKTVKVLVENKIGKNIYLGKTETFKNVKFSSAQNVIGKFVPVKITRANAWGLEGKST